jgi:lipopolysaccharide transport system ATP-binding protein
MTDTVVRARNLSKRYRIGPRRARYRTLRDSLSDLAAAPFRAFRRRGEASARVQDQTFWALQDVTFDIPAGTATGIVGRNGAGKSTLLKILSRITEPTKGFVEIQGRVSSLIEVGIGFRGELTGRENLYLNAAILGMRRADIEKRFNEIVAFAEVEEFVDTPVKHYSSGMYLRLAFAVAAHLDPEILIVDEVLAVGDAEFQKKCLNKMEEVGRQGRTVIFVSHNMPAVSRLCQRAILLDRGRVVCDGPATDVVSAYLKTSLGTSASREWSDTEPRPAGDVVGLLAVRVRAEDGRVTDVMDIRRPVRLEMVFDVWKPGYVLIPSFSFNNEEGIRAFSTVDTDADWRRKPRPVGRYVSTVWIPDNFLSEGTLFVQAELHTANPSTRQFLEKDIVAFQVVDSMEGDSARGDVGGPLQGVVRPKFSWTTEYSRPAWADSRDRR